LQLREFKELEHLKLQFISGYCSRGCSTQAKVLMNTGDQAYAYLRNFFHEKPEIWLFVLNLKDWKRLELPQKYEHGPFFKAYHTPYMVYYGSVIPEFWTNALFTLCDKAPERLKGEFLSMLGQRDKDFKSSFFRAFDLDLFSFSTVHEFTHIFCEANHVIFQIVAEPIFFALDTAWFTEFFCQYTFYSFLKKHNDEHAEKWFSIAELCYKGGKSQVKYTDLRDFGKRYQEMVSTAGGTNLLWYQFGKFMLMAKELYEKLSESFITETIREMKYGEENFLKQMQNSFQNFESWFQKWAQ